MAQALADSEGHFAAAGQCRGHQHRGLLYQSQHQHEFAIDDFSAAGFDSRNSDLFVARALSYSRPATHEIEPPATSTRRFNWIRRT